MTTKTKRIVGWLLCSPAIALVTGLVVSMIIDDPIGAAIVFGIAFVMGGLLAGVWMLGDARAEEKRERFDEWLRRLWESPPAPPPKGK